MTRITAASLLVVFALMSNLRADSFHVAVNGVDAPERDGRTPETAWRSLAYACERTPAGQNAIHVAPGIYAASRTAFPKSGVTIVGRKPFGKDVSRIVADTSWRLTDQPHKLNPTSEYLIAISKGVKDVRIHSLALESNPGHRITGAIRVANSENVRLHDLTIREFRWCGVHVEHSKKIQLHDSRIENASTDKSQYWGGLIRTRWIRESEIFNNRIISHVGGGYGYKGGGHVGVRIHHNEFDVRGGFAIESAHENEFGVEIDHNVANHCISIPKGGQAADPNTRGYEYSFWIHHNYLTHSYTIEGPRNHLRFSHNYVHIEEKNGRVYTHHGGNNHGPVWFHNNVVENVDRGLIWMNNGLAENIFVYNNTVFCSDAGSRTGALLSAYREDRLNNWKFKNNVVVAAWSRSRPVMPLERGVPAKIEATNNLFINMTHVPEGNFQNRATGISRVGSKPTPFYIPEPGSFVIDRGVDVGLPYQGKAPELGAFELGENPDNWDIPTPRKR